MKPTTPFRLAAALLAAAGTFGVAHAQTPTPRPYVETTSLTFLWNFVSTGVSSSTEPSNASPGPDLDPGTYDPTLPITTDIGSLQSYTGGNGDHEYIMRLLIQSMTRNRGFNLDEDYYIRDTDETTEVLRPQMIFRPEATKNWQLTAVREVPRTVEEMATNPYTLYLTIIDRTFYGLPEVRAKVDEYGLEETHDLTLIRTTINTGITFSLGEWAASGAVREKYSGPYVTSATGRVTTAFSMQMGALFYEDPRYLADNDATPAEYHLKRHIWQAFANGHIIYNMRSVPGPAGTNIDGTFYAFNVDMKGTGWFSHQFLDCKADEEPEGNFFISEILDTSYAYSGLAPLRVKMSNIQYQNRNMFPGFGLEPEPAP